MKPKPAIRWVFVTYTCLVTLATLFPTNGQTFAPWDKIAHLSAYGAMAILALLSFDSNPSRAVALVFVLVLGPILEWAQSFVPGRDPSAWDELANALGILSGLVIFRLKGEAIVNRIQMYFHVHS